MRVRGSAERQRFRDGRQERRRQAPPRRGQEFEGLIQAQRIGSIRRHQRSGPQQGTSPRRPGHVCRPATDLLAVPADGVDLAVMGDRPERLGQAPDRVRVGRVSLVEERIAQRQRRTKVGVEIRQASADDQALVHDRPGRGGRDGQRPDRASGGSCCRLETPPGDDQALLEGHVGDRSIVRRTPRRATHDRMHERWARCRRRWTERGHVGRDRTPRVHSQAAVCERLLHEAAGRSLCRSAPGQEERHDPWPVGRQLPGDEGQE